MPKTAASMEPQRGEEQPAVGGAGSGGGDDDDAVAAACLCPAAIAGAARGNLFPPRHALEQEMLRRAELQLHLGGGGDRRRERMMKNRESAARSRARRHAYVRELEQEVSLLQAENEQLRKLCQELTEAGEAAPPATSRAPQLLLRRTSSAPL